MQALRLSFRERVGTTLGEKYSLQRLLGIGGMAAVYEATNTWTGRRVAIKLLKSDGESGEERVKRFLQEARAAAQIEHPNVLQVLDLGRDAEDGTLYMVAEHLTGSDLRALLDERTRLPPRAALEIMVPVMSGLAAAHKLGVVHRDIKPGNIFLSRTPTGEIVPKVIDFGVSKLASSTAEITRTGTTVGTPEYMSPEQAHGDRTLDARTDVWSTGVVLYEVLSGRCPFEHENYHALLARIILGGVERLDEVAQGVPKGVADVVHRALQRDRARRWATIEDFADALLAAPELRNEPWLAALQRAFRAPAAHGPDADSVRRMVSDAAQPPPVVEAVHDTEPTFPDEEKTVQQLAPPAMGQSDSFDGHVPALASPSGSANPNARSVGPPPLPAPAAPVAAPKPDEPAPAASEARARIAAEPTRDALPSAVSSAPGPRRRTYALLAGATLLVLGAIGGALALRAPAATPPGVPGADRAAPPRAPAANTASPASTPAASATQRASDPPGAAGVPAPTASAAPVAADPIRAPVPNREPAREPGGVVAPPATATPPEPETGASEPTITAVTHAGPAIRVAPREAHVASHARAPHPAAHPAPHASTERRHGATVTRSSNGAPILAVP